MILLVSVEQPPWKRRPYLVQAFLCNCNSHAQTVLICGCSFSCSWAALCKLVSILKSVYFLSERVSLNLDVHMWSTSPCDILIDLLLVLFFFGCTAIACFSSGLLEVLALSVGARAPWKQSRGSWKTEEEGDDSHQILDTEGGGDWQLQRVDGVDAVYCSYFKGVNNQTNRKGELVFLSLSFIPLFFRGSSVSSKAGEGEIGSHPTHSGPHFHSAIEKQ